MHAAFDVTALAIIVLKTAKTAAVLLEAGVIANRADEGSSRSRRCAAGSTGAVVRGLADCGALRYP